MNNIEKIPSASTLIPDALKVQISALFAKLTKDISLKAVLDYNDEKSMELGSFLKVIASCSDKVQVDFFEKGENLEIQEQLNGTHLPVVGIYTISSDQALEKDAGWNDTSLSSDDNVQDGYTGACFHGVPGGKEINSFLAAICYAGGAASPLDENVLEQIRLVKKEISIKVFVSLACHHCPHVAAACQKIAIENSYITADIYDAKLYPDIVEKYKIERVPMMIFNDSKVVMGQKNAGEIAEYLLDI